MGNIIQKFALLRSQHLSPTTLMYTGLLTATYGGSYLNEILFISRLNYVIISLVNTPRIQIHN